MLNRHPAIRSSAASLRARRRRATARRLLPGELAVLATLLLAVDAGTGALLGALPALLLVIPLLRGRYLGEELIDRARRAMTRRRRWAAAVPLPTPRADTRAVAPWRARPACGVRGPPALPA